MKYTPLEPVVVGAVGALLMLMIFASGCGYAPMGEEDHWPEAKPGQAEAMAVVLGFYGPHDGAPVVYWREGAELNCANGRGWMVGGVCSDGAYLPERPWRIDLAWTGSLRRSALAHEALHWWLDQTTGDPNYDHTGSFLEVCADAASRIPE